MKQAALTHSKGLPRTAGLRNGCGKKRYPDELAAKLALLVISARRDSGRHENRQEKRIQPRCSQCGGFHLTSAPKRGGRRQAMLAASAPPGTVRPARRKAARDTGFSPAVKMLIRTRAGNGDPQDARCEACGAWLGEHGGQIQHIYARQSGGSARRLYRSAANGALLCGTPETGCHGLCEDRDEHMNEMGFWRKRNGQEKPGDYPVRLHGQGGGALVRLTPEGTYASAAPGEAALVMPYAPRENRRQNWRPLGRILVAPPAVVALPVALMVVTIAFILYAAANAILGLAMCAWRWAREPRVRDEYRDGGFSLRDIPQASRDRFMTELLSLGLEMARVARARADEHNLGEGTER